MQIFFLTGLWKFVKKGHLPVKLHSSAPRASGRSYHQKIGSQVKTFLLAPSLKILSLCNFKSNSVSFTFSFPDHIDDIDLYTYANTYSRLILLVSLQDEGYIFRPSENEELQLRGSIAFLSADNLGAQEVGGFKVGAGADKICRECLTNKELAYSKVLFQEPTTISNFLKKLCFRRFSRHIVPWGCIKLHR